MSAYSTLYITRDKALLLYCKKVLSITDEQLEDFLDNYLEQRLYNAVVVDNDRFTNDDQVL